MAINLVLVLTLFNGVAVQAARLVLPLYALSLGASALTVGILGASFAMLPLVLSVPAGRIADRFGSRWLLMFSAVGAGLSMLVPYFEAGITGIFVAALIMGLAFGIYNVSMQTLIGMLSTSNNRARNYSNWSLANAATNFVAPLVAGYSVEHAGYGNSCLYLALLTVVPVGILAVWGRALPGGMLEGETKESGSMSLLSQPGVKKALAASSLLLTGVDLYRIYMPVYGHAVGLTPSVIGIVLSAFAVAAFVVRLVMQPLISRFKEERVLAACFYFGAACLAAIPLVHSGMALAVISFVFGLGMGCGQPIITLVMYNNSPRGRAGEAMGLRMTVVHFTRMVGPVLFGSIASVLGLLGMYWVNALMMGAGGWLSRPAKKN